jgi:hypothetical protein
MTPKEIEALADAAAAAVQLDISPAQRPGVLQYLALAADYAEQLAGMPLGLDDESGSVFIPVSPATDAEAVR